MSGWDRFERVSPAGGPAAAASAARGASGWDQFERVPMPGEAAPARPAEDTSILGRIRSGATWMQDQVTGRDRTEFDFPNLDTGAIMPGGPIRREQGMLNADQQRGMNALGRFDFAADDKGRLDILRAARPDIAGTAKEDRFGNIYVTVDGKPAYLNRPGLTGRALSSGFASALSSLPLAATTGLAGIGASLPVRSGMSAGVGAGGSLIQDAVAKQGGSQQGADLPRAAVAGAFGAGLELAAPAKAALVGLFRARPNEFATVAANGAINLTPAGQKVFIEAGLDPQNMTQDALKSFMADVRKAVRPGDAARLSESRGLPVAVPLSRGDITGTPSQQMFESLSEKGSFGPGAETMMRGFRSEQQDAIRQNIPAIQSRIGGGQIAERGQAGANVVSTLQTQRAAQEAGVDAAYTAARNAGAGVAPDDLSRVYSGIVSQQGVADRIAFAPQAQTLIDNLGKTLANARDGGATTTNIKALYDWRRQATTLAREAGTSTERAAAKEAVKAFDAQMDDLAANALIQGDAAAVSLWKDAIGKASAKFRTWDADTLVAKLADADPLAASNIIFGSKDAGFINSPELVKGLRQLKAQVPLENWNAIREEAFLRLAQQGEGAYQGATRDFSGVNFKKAWDNLNMKNPALARELFTGEERQLINQFSNVAAKATGRVRGGDNFSNTTPAAANMFQRLVSLPFMTPRLVATVANTPGAGAVLGVAATAKAAGATSGRLPTVRGFPALTGTAGNVATGDQ